jgi:hypothetical protein
MGHQSGATLPSFQIPLHLPKNALGKSNIFVESGHSDNSVMKSVVESCG